MLVEFLLFSINFNQTQISILVSNNHGQQHSDVTVIGFSNVCVFKQNVFWLMVNNVREMNILNQAADDLMHLDLIQ